jgi:DNA-binding transcriptional regulator YhcF (GntR family)
MDGWIKLHRCLINKPIWAASKPEQKAVLITILCLANHESKEWIWQGQKFVVREGQFITSLDSLAKKSGVSRKSVRTALANFEKLEFLANESAKTGRLITVINWALYQSQEEAPAKESAKHRQSTGKAPATNKNDKNDKNERKERIPASGYDYFSDFWKEYPRKEKKVMAQKIFDRLKVNDALMEKIMDSLFRFVESEEWKKDDGKYIPHPTTWLNQRRWEDGT